MQTNSSHDDNHAIAIELLREKLRWMLPSRAVIVFILYVSFVTISAVGGKFPLGIATIIAVFAEATVPFFYYLYTRITWHRTALAFHLAVDLLMVWIAILISGGLEGPFSWMFMLVVFESCVYINERAGYLVAAAGSLLLAALIPSPASDGLTKAFGWPVARGSDPPLMPLLSNITLFFCTAVLVGQISDKLTEALIAIRQRSNMLAQISITDHLTGLCNQRYLGDRLAQEAARAERDGSPFCLAFFDLDDFKAINDTRGHLAGDRVLKDIAAAIESTIRKGLDIAFRYGGDEFVVLFGDSDEMKGKIAMERIKDAVRASHPDLKFSIGLAQRLAGQSGYDVLGAADRAMYKAKEMGGDTIVMSNADGSSLAQASGLRPAGRGG